MSSEPLERRQQLHLEQLEQAAYALAKDEARINRLAVMVGLLTVGLTAIAILSVLIIQLSDYNNYLFGALIVFLPVLFGIPAIVYVRNQHVGAYRKYHSQLMAKTAQFQLSAVTDPLTQIYNRRYFYDSLAAMLQSARNSKGVFSVILLDLDGLKAINDNYGHLVGDSIITGFAALLSQTVRDSDIVARLGGDEFGIIMPHSDKQGAFALSKRLWEELERRPVYQKDDLVINVSVSIGVSGYPWGGETVEAILQWADRDMYANKVAHKFRPQLAATQPATSAAADLDLIPDL